MSGSSGKLVESEAPPVRSNHKPKRRRWIAALVIAGLVAGLTVLISIFHGWLALWLVDDSPAPLQRQFRDLPLVSEFKLIAEEHTNTCIGRCRILDRYYVSDLALEEACAEIGRKLNSWGNVNLEQTRPGVWCSFRGTKNRYEVVASVTKDRTIDTPTATQREITEAHQSVFFIGLRDS